MVLSPLLLGSLLSVVVDVPLTPLREGVPFVDAFEEAMLEDDKGETRVKDLLTIGDNSASTWRALSAEEARRWVGNGVRTTLKRNIVSTRASLVCWERK